MRRLGIQVSADTLIRQVKRAARLPALPQLIRVLGVDDWAWCKGQTFGTILVDLERRQVVDLLPTRSADSREKADVTVVLLKNDNYAILNIELARVREGEPNEKMLTMLHLNNPTLDSVKIAEGQGVPASRATTAEEFHKQFEAAMGTKGPHLIEAQIVQDIQPMIDGIRKSR